MIGFVPPSRPHVAGHLENTERDPSKGASHRLRQYLTPGEKTTPGMQTLILVGSSEPSLGRIFFQLGHFQDIRPGDNADDPAVLNYGDPPDVTG